jgi:hypothetical protein
MQRKILLSLFSVLLVVAAAVSMVSRVSAVNASRLRNQALAILRADDRGIGGTSKTKSGGKPAFLTTS